MKRKFPLGDKGYAVNLVWITFISLENLVSNLEFFSPVLVNHKLACRSPIIFMVLKNEWTSNEKDKQTRDKGTIFNKAWLVQCVQFRYFRQSLSFAR